ncbi:MAG: ATP-binding cassette domain-containing protein [Bifidobacteriaceae bacterium]|jgi:ABC-2 type transport system ATP-binding protein|nr:ATP-binding cassette domain-containing protein [Bifidobacteriaceae bacterium]
MSRTAIEMTGVIKQYGDHRALDGLNLEVRAGEIFGLLGPNGAGKTTAMRVIMGLARADAGEVAVFGSAPGSRTALAATGALIETPALYPGLTGLEHLRAVARWRGAGESRAAGLLELVDLADAGKKKTRDYSLGMKQRLGVATALLGDPALLVLDEPSNGLDPAGMRDMRSLLLRLADADRAVLLSSHLLGEVEQVATRVGIIARGRMAQVLNRAEFEERGLDEAFFAATNETAGGGVARDGEPGSAEPKPSSGRGETRP